MEGKAASPLVEIYCFPLPPTMNQIISAARNSPFVSARQKAKWTNEAALIAFNRYSFPGKVWAAWFWEVTNLRYDEDNLVASRKFILDGLVQAGVIKDDSLQIIQTPVIHFHSKGKVNQVTLQLSNSPRFLYELMDLYKEDVFRQ